MMTPEERAAWLAEIELCDNMDSLDLVYAKLQELDREAGAWAPLRTQSIVDALVFQREKLKWRAWENTGMAIANIESIKKLEIRKSGSFRDMEEESAVADQRIREARALWTPSKP